MNKYTDFTSRVKSPDIGKSNSKLLDYNSNCLSLRLKMARSVNDFIYAQTESGFYSNRSEYRVSSPGISSLSQAHNEMLKNSSLKTNPSYEKTLKFPDLTGRFTTEKNFSDIIEKLDEIISPRAHFTEILLNDSESQQYNLESEGYLCFKIVTKGKKCPLCIKINQLNNGKILKFFSLTDNKPGFNSKQRSYNGNYLEINDTTYEFKSEFAYLGIKALIPTNFKIFFNFGKFKQINLFSKYHRNESDSSEYVSSDDDINQIINGIEGQLKYKSSKNFVKINMRTKLLNSMKKNEEIQIRAEKWKNKREEVLHRKKQNLKEKKVKTVRELTKRIQRLEEESLKRENAEKKIELLKFNRKWIRVLYIVVSLEKFQKIICDKRNQFWLSKKLDQEAIKIQRFYRRRISMKKVRQYECIAARSLLLYHQHILPILFYNTKSTIVSAIRVSANNKLLYGQISSFVEKILLIQKRYREYVIKKQLKMRTLRHLWNNYIEKSLSVRRSSNIRRKESLKLISIPNVIRDNILKEYYYNCIKDFIKETKKYLEIINNRTKISVIPAILQNQL